MRKFVLESMGPSVMISDSCRITSELDVKLFVFCRSAGNTLPFRENRSAFHEELLYADGFV